MTPFFVVCFVLCNPTCTQSSLGWDRGPSPSGPSPLGEISFFGRYPRKKNISPHREAVGFWLHVGFTKAQAVLGDDARGSCDLHRHRPRRAVW